MTPLITFCEIHYFDLIDSQRLTNDLLNLFLMKLAFQTDVKMYLIHFCT